MISYQNLVTQALKTIPEVMPWDLEEKLISQSPPLVLDIANKMR